MSNYIEIARRVIQTEIEGLYAVKDYMGDNFTSLVNLILNMQGRVVLSGMGKSGHVAKKISATLASLGTPSYFIHPGEASHGDLGMITVQDVVFLLSNSGETKELADIINYCKRFNIKLVALVRKESSLLVSASDIAIILPSLAEASIINAPTTSTTMMLAFGDALAVTLAEAKGFSREDFGVFHPGGKLGSECVKTKDIMRSLSFTPICKADDSLKRVIDIISEAKIGSVAVCDISGKIIGVITDGDIRRFIYKGDITALASAIMTKSPKLISYNSMALEAVNIMNKYEITSIFVVEGENKLVGVLHIHDCFKAGII
jgi:arabinose-5-phosphate isomerase